MLQLQSITITITINRENRFVKFEAVRSRFETGQTSRRYNGFIRTHNLFIAYIR
jgi:hypothetical protein